MVPIGGESTQSVLSDRWIVYAKSRKKLLHRKYLLYDRSCSSPLKQNLMGYFRNSICESFLRKHDFSITKIKTKKSFKASDLRAKHRYNKVNIKKGSQSPQSGICICIKVKEGPQGHLI